MNKQEFIKNDRYEIYGEMGWENFKGVVVNEGSFIIHQIKTENSSIKCTDKHKIYIEGRMVCAKDIKRGDNLLLDSGVYDVVISNNIIESESVTYDIFDSDSHKVYINHILTSNCDEFAFVEPPWKADEFWASNYPTISASKESKIIIISTPNGLYNKFHEIYTGAEEGKNTFKHARFDYRSVPGRDEAWAKEQMSNLGKVKFNQEFGCFSENSLININNVLTNEIECITVGQLYERMIYENHIKENSGDETGIP